MPLSAGLGAQRLLRSVVELLSEALAAAWDGGARSGVTLLLLPRPASAGWHEQAVSRAAPAVPYYLLSKKPFSRRNKLL